MSKKAEIQKPIAEQIFDELFVLLQEHSEFDTETIDKLKQLAQNGDLRKAQPILKVIKTLPGIEHEIT